MQRTLSILAVVYLLITSCANQVRPRGGEKDVTSPLLLESTPKDSALNVVLTSISLEFDEFVRVQPNELVITPTLKNPILVKQKGKHVTLEIQDTLLSNTTYTMQFGNAIKDITEGNPLENADLVFSTGNYLDSLTLTGSVTDLEQGALAPRTLIGLYDGNSPDSLVISQRPLYFTTSDQAGRFSFKNLKNNTYKVFAIQDGNNNLTWDNNEKLGMASGVSPIRSADKLRMEIYSQESQNQSVKNVKFDLPGRVTWTSSKQKMMNDVEILYPIEQMKQQYFAKEVNDLHQLWIEPEIDSISLIITSNNKSETFNLNSPKAQLENLSLENAGRRKKQSVQIVPNRSLIITMNHPIIDVDTDLFRLVENDSTNITSNSSIAHSRDSLIVDYPWKYGTSYSIEMLPGAVTDWFDQKNDTMNIVGRTKSEEEIGNVDLKLIGFNEKESLILLLKNESGNEVLRQPIDSEDVSMKNLVPGKYILTIFNDADGDNQWDSGNIFLSKLPEEIKHYSDKIEVRANWSLNVQFDVGGLTNK